MKQKIINFLRKLFKKEEKKLIIQKNISLPEIDPRRPIVFYDEKEEPSSSSLEIEKQKEAIAKTCKLCKFAKFDDDDFNKYIICTLNPNNPTMKEETDTCLQHEPKYKNLKIILDKGMLLEYDSKVAKINNNYSQTEIGIQEIGEKEWQN